MVNYGLFEDRVIDRRISVPPDLLDNLGINNGENVIASVQKYDDTRPVIEQYEEALIISNEVLELHELCYKCDVYHILNETCRKKTNTRGEKSK